ncbi:MAG TPA: ATP-binding protein [Roseiflexaceae bacterium]|jgi:signal transduction histidine kinase|nr:ATP-binding protein [Roseiflexaceae bacterium]
MSAQQLIQYITWAFYLFIFFNVAIQAVRQPLDANFDIALFFTTTALIIAISTSELAGWLSTTGYVVPVTVALLLTLPYLLLRLVDDFSFVPFWLKRGAELTLFLLVVAGVLYVAPYPGWLNFLMLAYLVLLLIYCAIAFIRAAWQANGVTQRRMVAVATGTILLVSLFLLADVQLVAPALADTVMIFSGLVSLASGISYYLGFAPPVFLRRAWQEPELRAFLGRAASLPRLPDTASILQKLEEGASSSLGAPNARVGLWNPDDKVLRFVLDDGRVFDLDVARGSPAGQAFATKRPVFVPKYTYDDETPRPQNRMAEVTSLMIAPIIAGDRTLGVLSVYAPRTPVFVEDDLSLVQLLADQAAVILESRALIDEAARVRAREEATRMKDDFLSAAAHDLKTPLTTLIAQAQLLERRTLRHPEAPPDLQSIQRLVKEGQRLKNLVLELLDAMRAEQGMLLGQREQTDLVELVRETCAHHGANEHSCIVDSDGPVIGIYDRNRMSQLIENLVENAVKYSPDGGEVRVQVLSEHGQAHLLVCDTGIGIPAEDLPHVFDRFYRGKNVEDKRFMGMGLGLFICRGIVEQHGGRIWATRNPYRGTTMHVMLPSGVEEGGNDH